MTESSVRLSTARIAPRERAAWLREVIGREYARVEISPPADDGLFNDMTILPYQGFRLSRVVSNGIGIERRDRDVDHVSHDEYFAVLLLSGQYRLEQGGREVFLGPGDMALYDATRPHRIECPGHFSKLIFSVPRTSLRDRLGGAESLVAKRLSGRDGVGAVASDFLRSLVRRHALLSDDARASLSHQALDLLALALSALEPPAAPSRSRDGARARIKDFIERRLDDPALDAAAIAAGVGLSPRYVGELMQDEGTSPMRYVLGRRLERCRLDISRRPQTGRTISDIAFRWGFNDLSHFSRAFKARFGHSPRGAS